MKKQNSDTVSVASTITRYGRKMIDEALDVINKQKDSIKFDLHSPEQDEIINGLFFRILRFYYSFVLSFHFWSRDMAEIVARTMLESHFYLQYLLKENNKDLYLEFIKYGIGQEKLYKLQLAKLIDDKTLEETPEVIDFINSESDEELWDELVSIKLKNFDDLKKISEKAKLKDEYVLKYQPFSITTHGHWPSLKRFYLERCRNPLHRFHFKGTTQLPPLDLSFLFDNADLFYASYILWSKHYRLKDEVKLIIEDYLKKIEDFLSSERQKKKPVK